MKTVLFVPGFNEGLSTHDYAMTIAAIESKGYKVVFVPIAWKRTTIDDWVAQLDQVYANYDPGNVILAGFSFGSMTAFTVAAKRQPSELWLFSFSPYFAEDLPNLKPWWKAEFGKRRIEAFAKIKFAPLAESLSCKTRIFVGEAEAKYYPVMLERAKAANKAIRNSELTIVTKAKHDITSDAYVAGIAKAL